MGLKRIFCADKHEIDPDEDAGALATRNASYKLWKYEGTATTVIDSEQHRDRIGAGDAHPRTPTPPWVIFIQVGSVLLRRIVSSLRCG